MPSDQQDFSAVKPDTDSFAVEYERISTGMYQFELTLSANDKQLVISKMQLFIHMSKDVVLTNSEANRLFHVLKFSNTNESHTLSESRFSLGLQSEDGRDKFIFDFSSSSIVLRYKLQIRANRVFPLLRLDLGGSFHDNPYQEVECPEDDPFKEIQSPSLYTCPPISKVRAL